MSDRLQEIKARAAAPMTYLHQLRNSADDVPWLVAEVERLGAALAAIAEKRAALDAVADLGQLTDDDIGKYTHCFVEFDKAVRDACAVVAVVETPERLPCERCGSSTGHASTCPVPWPSEWERAPETGEEPRPLVFPGTLIARETEPVADTEAATE